MKKAVEPRRFVALDTETIEGRAFLLSTATGVYPIAGFADFVRIASGLGSDFVFYNLDYDITGLLAYLPPTVNRELYYKGRVAVDGGVIRYIPKKFFAFLPSSHKARPVRCYDLYSFFQMSLDAVAKKFLPETVRKVELPAGWWDDFTYDKYMANREMFDAYATQDAVVLQALSDKFFGAVDKAGLNVRHFYSPASLAKRYLYQTVGRRKVNLAEWMPFLEKAYFGGRIETWQRGFFPDVTIYDLKSAYPAVMRQLPDFRFPRLWFSAKPETPYYIARCRVQCSKPLIPFRSHNKIIFPTWTGNVATVTNWEIELVRRWGGDVSIEKVLNIDVPLDNVLQRPIDELYARRALGGMEKQVYKLVLNSLYGVFAQKVKRWRPVSDVAVAEYLRRRVRADSLSLFINRQAARCVESGRYWERKCGCSVCKQTRRIVRAVGRSRLFELSGDWDIGFYARYPMRTLTSNMLYAIYTTAGARVRLSDVMMQYASSFIAAATDSVMMLETMPETAGIGGWEKQYTGWLCMVGSGVYQTDAAVKFRGFDTSVDLLATLRQTDGLMIPIRQTRRESLARFARPVFDFGQPVSLNAMSDADKLLRVDFDTKRFWFDKLLSGRQLTEGTYQSRPLKLGREL